MVMRVSSVYVAVSNVYTSVPALFVETQIQDMRTVNDTGTLIYCVDHLVQHTTHGSSLTCTLVKDRKMPKPFVVTKSMNLGTLLKQSYTPPIWILQRWLKELFTELYKWRPRSSLAYQREYTIEVELRLIPPKGKRDV